jgi:hypothetical protein
MDPSIRKSPDKYDASKALCRPEFLFQVAQNMAWYTWRRHGYCAPAACSVKPRIIEELWRCFEKFIEGENYTA